MRRTIYTCTSNCTCRLTPLSAAIFLAKGLAKILSAAPDTGTAPAGGVGVGLGGGGAGVAAAAAGGGATVSAGCMEST